MQEEPDALHELHALLDRAGHFGPVTGSKGRRLAGRPGDFDDGVPEGFVSYWFRRPDGTRDNCTGSPGWEPTDGSVIESATPSLIDRRKAVVADLRTELERIARPLLIAATLPGPDAWRDLLADDLWTTATVEAARSTLPMRTPAPTPHAPSADADLATDPLLPIDEAAQLAGWPMNKGGTCRAARRAAKWKRGESLPTEPGQDGTLHARVSDCRTWLPLFLARQKKYAHQHRK